MRTKLEIGGSSDVGKVRAVNEDDYDAFSGEFGELIIVCNGMGDHKSGEIASRAAVNNVKEEIEVKDEIINKINSLPNSLQVDTTSVNIILGESTDQKNDSIITQ